MICHLCLLECLFNARNQALLCLYFDLLLKEYVNVSGVPFIPEISKIADKPKTSETIIKHNK